MNKDFPYKVFSCEGKQALLDRQSLPKPSITSYDIPKRLSKLTYSYPNEITYDNKLKKPKCLTQMYFSTDYLKQTSPLLPWHLAKRLDKGYDLYFDLYEATKNESEPEYYFADCKSTLAKFFPNLFAKGNAGKCIYTSVGTWMTPIDFQAYSGSTCADWRSSIQLRRPDDSKPKLKSERKVTNIKSLVDSGVLTVHSSTCACQKCQETSVSTQNINIFQSFFLDSGKQLVLLNPDPTDTSFLDIEIKQTILNDTIADSCSISDILVPLNKTNLSGSLDRSCKQTIESVSSDSKLKQIECQVFDEGRDYFNRHVVAEDVTEAFVSLSFTNGKAKTYVLDLNDENRFDIRLLYELNSRNDSISCIAGSHLIQGECAVVLDNSGDIYLAGEEICQGELYLEDENNGHLKIATNIQPLLHSLQNPWRSIRFGTQPRQFVYADESQLLSIDTRTKANLTCTLFSNATTIGNELIERHENCQNDYYTHLICTSSDLIVVDERFPNHSLLTWPHHFQSSCTLLKTLSLPSYQINKTHESHEYTHMVVGSDSSAVFCYQFSLKNGMYLSHNFPRQLDSPKDLVNYLPTDYDKRLKRHLDYRLNKPVIGLSMLQYRNSFAMFQMQQNCDLFYECFEVGEDDSETSVTNRTKLMKKWLDSVGCDVITDYNNDFNTQFKGLDLSIKQKKGTKKKDLAEEKFDFEKFMPSPSKLCKICNDLPEFNQSNCSHICPRCGLSIEFTHNIMSNETAEQLRSEHLVEELFLIDLDSVDLEASLTKELYSRWQDDSDTPKLPTDLFYSDRAKRSKISSSP